MFPLILNLIKLAGSRELSGIVLSRDPAGDRFLRIRIFDRTEGLSAALFPVPAKGNKKSSPPDLFDVVECILKPVKAESSIPFVLDFKRVHSFRELASKPIFFITASEIARFYLNNGSHLLDPAPHLKLLYSSLDSFSRVKAPKVVLLKLYFRFAREEGLPVRESWLAGLPSDLHDDALEILKLPVDKTKIVDSKIYEVLESLKIWMNAETELRVD